MHRWLLSIVLILAAPATAELRDPTRPPSSQRARPKITRSVERPVLRGILVSPRRRVAQIGGRRVVEGDQILGGRVARIERTSVVIARGDQEVVLRLSKPVATRSAETEEGP